MSIAKSLMAKLDESEKLLHLVYSGKTNDYVSSHDSLTRAKSHANHLEAKTGYTHRVVSVSSGNRQGVYKVHSSHDPNWNYVTSGNRSNWDTHKSNSDIDRIYAPNVVHNPVTPRHYKSDYPNFEKIK
jgi:hypothetical protein